jgi:hypothetical protein
VAGSRNPCNTTGDSGVGTDGREVHRTYEDAGAMVGELRNLRDGGRSAVSLLQRGNGEGNAEEKTVGTAMGGGIPYLRTPAAMRSVRTGGAPFASRRRRSVPGNPSLSRGLLTEAK